MEPIMNSTISEIDKSSESTAPLSSKSNDQLLSETTDQSHFNLIKSNIEFIESDNSNSFSVFDGNNIIVSPDSYYSKKYTPNVKLLNNHYQDPIYYEISNFKIINDDNVQLINNEINNNKDENNLIYQNINSTDYLSTSSLDDYQNTKQSTNSDELSNYLNKSFNEQSIQISEENLTEINGQKYLKIIQENLIPIYDHKYYSILELSENENSHLSLKENSFNNSTEKVNNSNKRQLDNPQMINNISVNQFLSSTKLDSFSQQQSNDNQNISFQPRMINLNSDSIDDDIDDNIDDFLIFNNSKRLKTSNNKNILDNSDDIIDYVVANSSSIGNILNNSSSKKRKDAPKKDEKKPKVECPQCHKFYASGYIAKHIKTHTGEKSHVCETCGAKFSAKSSLKRHVKIHNGEFDYVCQTCNKTFIDGTSLEIHSRKHSGEKPYKCDICEKSFVQLGSLNTHKIKKHPIIIKEIDKEQNLSNQLNQDQLSDNLNKHNSSLSEYNSFNDNHLFLNMLNDPSLNYDFELPN